MARPPGAAGSIPGCTRTASTRPRGASPGRSRAWVAPEWGWAWPANRRILYNRASADPDGKPWSERKAYVWWDEERAEAGPATTYPTSRSTKAPSLSDPSRASAARPRSPATTRSSCSPTARDGCSRRAGCSTARCRRTTSRRSRRWRNALYRAAGQPDHERSSARTTISATRRARSPAGEVFPYVVDHLPADRTPHGGRDEPLAAVPRRAAAGVLLRGLAANWPRSGDSSTSGWATIVTARTAIEARVLVTERMSPLTVGGRPCIRSGCRTTGASAAAARRQRRLGQRPVRRRARPERAHPGVQGGLLRHPARAPADAARRCCDSSTSTGVAPGHDRYRQCCGPPNAPRACRGRREARR